MKKLTRLIILFTALILPLTSNAITQTFYSSGATVQASFVFQDNCRVLSGNLSASENSNRTQSVKTGSNGAIINYFEDNSCTNQIITVAGSTDSGVSFKKAGRTVTVSGSVPVTLLIFDKITFESTFDNSLLSLSDLTFTQNSDVVTKFNAGTTTTETKVGKNTFRTVSNSDSSSSTATVTGGFINPVDGALFDLSSGSLGSIGISRGHSTLITIQPQ